MKAVPDLADPESFPPEPSPNPRAMMIIVGENQPARNAIAEFLKSGGYASRLFDRAREYLETPLHDGPACVVLVDGLHRESLALIQTLRAADRADEFVIVSGHPDFRECVEMVRAGATDYLTLPCGGGELKRAVELALQRSGNRHEQRTARKRAETLAALLTKREREVFRLLVEGHTNREIGMVLGAAEATVKVHRRRVMDKMEARSLAELLFRARQAGLDPHFTDGQANPPPFRPGADPRL